MADIHPGQLRRWLANDPLDAPYYATGPVFIVIKAIGGDDLVAGLGRDWQVMGSGGRVRPCDEGIILKYSEPLDG